jgi:hypothetical protein
MKTRTVCIVIRWPGETCVLITPCEITALKLLPRGPSFSRYHRFWELVRKKPL